MSRSSLNSLALVHEYLTANLKPGGFCIDATAGRGRDCAFLCSLVGEKGKVIAMDIQQDAVDSTNALLKESGYSDFAHAVLDSHANMASYAEADSVDCITFNFGWLPGGNHGIFTRAESSIAAIKSGLELLKTGGIMTLCIYYGRDCGYEERDALLEYIKTIDFKRYTVIMSQFVNRPNDPPIPVFITKD